MSSAPKTITTYEAATLLEHLLVAKGTQRQMLNGVRNHTIGLLMIDAGLRVGEVVGLKISDLIVQGQPAKAVVIGRFNSKNNAERTIPLTSRIQGALSLMLKHWWGSAGHTTRPAFFRHFVSGKPMTCRQVQKIISDTALEFIGRRVNPHVLRHTFATRMMRVTDSRTVQTLLGHKKLSSTQVYLHPDMTDLENAIKRINLLEDGKTSQVS